MKKNSKQQQEDPPRILTAEEWFSAVEEAYEEVFGVSISLSEGMPEDRDVPGTGTTTVIFPLNRASEDSPSGSSGK